ncbi:MAG: hypothetical protein KIT57_11915 [Blastocatellales bacterium]|nr:hypothetical protein [Blastocatellales bacterium]
MLASDSKIPILIRKYENGRNDDSADLLELKARLDDWRAGRTHHRQPIPGDLREAVLEMSRLYMPSLVRRILKIDPGG